VQKSVTVKVRLLDELKRKIQRKAASDGCGTNSVIITALEFYLRKDEHRAYKTEARRQSQLATLLDPPDAAREKLVGLDFPQERANFLNSLPVDSSPLKR
jgi:hypothetical protein